MTSRHTSPPPGPSVYPPREDTELLERTARGLWRGRVLEIGTGSGSIALASARAGARVAATDRNPEALRLLRARARAEGLSVDAVRTDLADGLRRFDFVLANPPYLPTRATERDPDPWVDLALNGGPDGCRTWARILRSLPHVLRPGGRAFVLESSRMDLARRTAVRASWQARGGAARLVDRRGLEGETLEVWEWIVPPAARRPARSRDRTRIGRRRTERGPKGTGGRRPTPPPRRPGSSPGTATGRSSARGEA